MLIIFMEWIYCRYDIFGAWYSDQYFLSGGLTWLELTISKSEIWINKASQEADSEHKAVLNCLYKFYNSAVSGSCRVYEFLTKMS